MTEGPYMALEVIQPGAYRLKDDNGNVLTNTWSAGTMNIYVIFP